MTNINPFIDEHFPDHFIRIFDEHAEDDNFYWHKDSNNRIISPLKGQDWQLQLDNQIPQKLHKNSQYFIPRETWHRIIKGSGQLILKIEENQ